MDNIDNKVPACDRCKEKKVKCDRGQPSCQNCLRNSLPCESLSQKKRTNPTKQLASDFEKIAARLDDLDKTVSRSAFAIEKLLATGASPLASHHDRSTLIVSAGVSGLEEEEEVCLDLPYYSVNNNGNEIYHGPSSLLSFLNCAQSQWLTTLIQDGTHGKQRQNGPKRSQETMLEDDYAVHIRQKFLDGLAKVAQTEDLDLSSDGAPLVLPPKTILDALSDPFFDHVSPILPALGKRSFQEAVSKVYGRPLTPADVPWALLFNNLILSSLPVQIGPDAGEDRSTDMRTKMPGDLVKPFIVNANRALARLDLVLTPRLESVQALLSFSVISSKNFQIRKGAFLLRQACELAKTIGLHQELRSHRAVIDLKTDERRTTFWALFILDKQLSLLLGIPCTLPFNDVSVPAPNHGAENPLHGHFAARVHMARIQEQIYSELYATNSARKSATARQSSINRLIQNLRDWHVEHLENLVPGDTSSWGGKPFINVELMHSYHNSRIMILRRSSEPGSRAKCLEVSRSSIRFMQQSRKAKLSVGGFMVLRRPFQFYPFVAFFEIFSNFASYPHATAPLSDLDLLRNAVEMIREIVSPSFPETYCWKLFEVASTCVDIASSLVERMESRRNASSKTSAVASPRGLVQNGSINDRQYFAPVQSPAYSPAYPPQPMANLNAPYSTLTPQSSHSRIPSVAFTPSSTISSVAAKSPHQFVPPTSYTPTSTPHVNNHPGPSTSYPNPLQPVNNMPDLNGDMTGLDNFEDFEFDLDTIWGDSQLLEDMAKGTNIAIMANGYV